MTEANTKPVTVTLSQATKAYLASEAKKGFRSLNKELSMRLEESRAREMAEEAKKELHELQA